ncbi:olfactory receptor 5AP2-like [Leptosomus discolor]
MAEGERGNGTSPTDFVLLVIWDVPMFQNLLFLLLLVVYAVTMVGNIFVIVLVVANQHLHTPMYFLLGSLSFLETCSSSTILPRLLVSFLTGDSSISAHGCTAQFYFLASVVTTECCLLAAMSYDLSLAICQPLLYLQFCGPKAIDLFCWDFTPLLELACGDTRAVTVVAFLFGILDAVVPFLFTVASYGGIRAAILRIPSSPGRQKAFSTCSSHLTLLIIFYGTLILVSMLPTTAALRQLNKVFSLFYTVLTALLNPLIYSLRNREVQEIL